MDLEEKFHEVVKETVSTLLRKGKSTEQWTADDGVTVVGWRVKSWDQPTELKGNPVGNGWWRETWGNGCTILTRDGEFWEYAFHGKEEADKPTELTRSLRRTPQFYLVGSGKPFSRMIEHLERLPYL